MLNIKKTKRLSTYLFFLSKILIGWYLIFFTMLFSISIWEAKMDLNKDPMPWPAQVHLIISSIFIFFFLILSILQIIRSKKKHYKVGLITGIITLVFTIMWSILLYFTLYFDWIAWSIWFISFLVQFSFNYLVSNKKRIKKIKEVQA